MKLATPIIIFIMSALLSLLVLPLALLLSLLGLLVVCIILVRKNTTPESSNLFDDNPALMHSALVLLFTPIMTVSLVATLLAGFFS